MDRKFRMSGSGPERIYIKVVSEFDQTGYMRPVSITWKNGRSYRVEAVRDFRPAVSQAGKNCPGDCYTVVIGGAEKHLFFERAGSLFPSRVGRWFVETV